jgi:CubicO group peptidase (beta-lactamase class C family)
MRIWFLRAAVLGLALFGTRAASAEDQATPVLAPAAPEAVGFSSDGIERLNAAMHGAVDQKDVVGIVTLLARHGRIVDFDAYGKKSLTTGEPITKDTIFRMYSQTKPVTGAAMMILYDQEKWRLEDPVTKFIPEFAGLKVLTGLDKDGKPLVEDAKRSPNMRELMTHSAGFGYGLRGDNYVDQQFRTQRVLSSNGLGEMVGKISTIPLLFQPGTRWSYSAAVDIQGDIIEKLSGETLADFMADRIFKPLGMKDTGFVVPADKVGRLSAVFATNPKTGELVEITPQLVPLLQDFTKQPPLFSGGGGSVSTAEDFARFCQMILNHGELGGARVLSPSSVALMEADQLESTVVPEQRQPGGLPPIGGDAIGFGLDFAVVKDATKLRIPAATGAITWGGAAGTWFWIDPKNDLFFIGLIQKFGAAAGNEKLRDLSQATVYSALVHPEK